MEVKTDILIPNISYIKYIKIKYFLFLKRVRVTLSKISLLLPTRGRKNLLERLFDSFHQTTSDLSLVEIVMCIDDDDAATQRMTFDPVFNVKKIIGKRSTMGTYNTKCLEHSSGDIIILFNDDVVVRTKDWDKMIIDFDAKHPDKIYLAYVNDLFKKKKVGSFPILSRKTCDVVKDPFPSPYKGEHIDYHLFDIFKRLSVKGYERIHYFEDTVFEHMHFSQGKASFDQTYLDRKMYSDDEVFVAYSPNRRNAAERLVSVIQGKSLPKITESPRIFPAGPDHGYIRTLYASFIKDRSLPFFWRLKLFLWFSWRFFAKQGKLLWIKKLVYATRKQGR